MRNRGGDHGEAVRDQRTDQSRRGFNTHCCGIEVVEAERDELSFGRATHGPSLAGVTCDPGAISTDFLSEDTSFC
jgi:hypothetical protein